MADPTETDRATIAAMDRTRVDEWVEGYVAAWRTGGTDGLGSLFTPDATYLPSPWADPVTGAIDLAAFWERERAGPDERFTFEHRVLAVDGDTAVVRVAVDYGDPVEERWRDLWIIRFDGDDRCRAFEEWPFAPPRRS